MSLDPMEVHRNLMRSLPVRTVLCQDHEEERETYDPQPPRTPAEKNFSGRGPKPAGYVSPIQRAQIGVRRMLSHMRAGAWYSGKHLAALAGMNEKAFYTHVRRMVDRKQLIRSGSRHSFRYCKASR